MKLVDLLKEPLRNGKSAVKSNSESGIPIISLSAVTFKNFSPETIKLCELREKDVEDLWIKKNDIFISRSNTREYVGMAVIYEGKNNQFIFPDLLIRVRVDNSLITPAFLAFYLDSFGARTYFQRHASSTAGSMDKITQTHVENLSIPLPPIAEQKRIVQCLQYANDTIKCIMNEIDEQLKLKRGLMQRLLTRGIGHTRFKQTKIGEIPEKWDIQPLIELGQYINGYAFKPTDWVKSGLPIIRIKQLNDPQADLDYYSGILDSKYMISDGNLLFSWSGTLGSYIWNRGNAYLNQHIFKVIPKKGVDKYYLHYLLDRSVVELVSHSHGSTMKHIKKGVLKRFFVAVPPITEQKEIVSILNSVDSIVTNERKILNNLEILKKGLMQVLLTGKVRVKV